MPGRPAPLLSTTVATALLAAVTVLGHHLWLSADGAPFFGGKGLVFLAPFAWIVLRSSKSIGANRLWGLVPAFGAGIVVFLSLFATLSSGWDEPWPLFVSYVTGWTVLAVVFALCSRRPLQRVSHRRLDV
ncbi:hypothetical protein [Allokutzneria albata]|uniref:DUF3054 domain-containing protein n=1 Tax=Allokutzneria albata TaxID=211114 RepID=A0A1G9V3M4_ALLAB|nr:hypothetical protein [Allokutzneria albata]SDM66657.1 hypothetical protein SAMN04489726_2805 [Allokutzneria albata]